MLVTYFTAQHNETPKSQNQSGWKTPPRTSRPAQGRARSSPRNGAGAPPPTGTRLRGRDPARQEGPGRFCLRPRPLRGDSGKVYGEGLLRKAPPPQPRQPARDPAGGAAVGDTPQPPHRQNNTGQGSARPAVTPRPAQRSSAGLLFGARNRAGRPRRPFRLGRSPPAAGGGRGGGGAERQRRPGLGRRRRGRCRSGRWWPQPPPPLARSTERGDSPAGPPAGPRRSAGLGSAGLRWAPPPPAAPSGPCRDSGTRQRHARDGAAERATVTRGGRGCEREASRAQLRPAPPASWRPRSAQACGVELRLFWGLALADASCPPKPLCRCPPKPLCHCPPQLGRGEGTQ
ncbi:basic salivary proline-rich protein 1-like [Corapipo altera]|uniref:basic salivary proline-rich protein 1-like n=1 Tax=Corapipo altera TaxID=415028 RepID=UPI000FD6309C|nr:basic salivary proline-rich protein 1-like [Corapipo altera]